MCPIPTELEPDYGRLKNEVTWLHGHWLIYRQLFAQSERRIDLLNECASAFFFVLEKTLFSDVLVSLCRLTDPHTQRGRRNLSLGRILARIEVTGELEITEHLREILNDLNIDCEPFRVHRNRRLAHLDLETALRTTASPPPGISREMIENALARVREFMNAIQRHYDKSETRYEHFLMRQDANALVEMIKYGFRYEELLKNRAIPYDDWRNGYWNDA